jgi:hypothetical protein
MGASPLEGTLIIAPSRPLVIFFKEHWSNILAMRVRNKHLEPRGCDTIGDTITDEKVSILLSVVFIENELFLNRFVVYIFL